MCILKEGVTVSGDPKFRARMFIDPPYLVIRGMDDRENPVFLILRADAVQTLIEEWEETIGASEEG